MKGVSLPFAVALIIVGGSCLAIGLRIEESALSGEHDPGPKALPLALSGLLLIGGIGACIARVVARDETDATSINETGPETVGFGNAPASLGAFLLYVIAIPWLGFQLSTLTFVSGMLIWLGARWWSALLMAMLVICVVRFVFGNLFYVQLPEGAFGLAF